GLRDAFSKMTTSLSAEGYVVERMESAAVSAEVIVGCRRDPRFGPLVLVGLGGPHAQGVRDPSAAVPPGAPGRVEGRGPSLKGAALLTGVRGRPALDVAGLCRAAAALSRLAAEHPEIAEVEVNPLLLTPERVVGLDARVVLGSLT